MSKVEITFRRPPLIIRVLRWLGFKGWSVYTVYTGYECIPGDPNERLEYGMEWPAQR